MSIFYRYRLFFFTHCVSNKSTVELHTVFSSRRRLELAALGFLICLWLSSHITYVLRCNMPSLSIIICFNILPKLEAYDALVFFLNTKKGLLYSRKIQNNLLAWIYFKELQILRSIPGIRYYFKQELCTLVATHITKVVATVSTTSSHNKH